MEKNKILIIFTIVISLLLGLVGYTYSFYTTQITGNDTASSVIVDIGSLRLLFTDGDNIRADHIELGWSDTKEFTVENTGTLEAKYEIRWANLLNTLVHRDCLTYMLYKDGELIDSSQVQSSGTNVSIYRNISIEPQTTHTYRLEFTYSNMQYDQSSNMGKKFYGKLEIVEYNFSWGTIETFMGNSISSATLLNLTSPAELEELITLVNNGNRMSDGVPYSQANVKLVGNISSNLSQPLGSRDYPFEGQFDGNGNQVLPGLFGYVRGASIEYLSIVSQTLNFTSNSKVFGGLINVVTDSVNIQNCGVTNLSITSSGSSNIIGGLIGKIESSSNLGQISINNSQVNTVVINSMGSNDALGGIVGQINAPEDEIEFLSTNVYGANIQSSGTNSKVGMFIGKINAASSSYTNCGLYGNHVKTLNGTCGYYFSQGTGTTVFSGSTPNANSVVNNGEIQQ